MFVQIEELGFNSATIEKVAFADETKVVMIWFISGQTVQLRDEAYDSFLAWWENKAGVCRA